MAERRGKEGNWITTEKGSHVFIEKGKSVREAFKNAFENYSYDDDPEHRIHTELGDYQEEIGHILNKYPDYFKRYSEARPLFDDLYRFAGSNEKRIALQEKLGDEFVSNCKKHKDKFFEDTVSKVNPGYDYSHKLEHEGDHSPDAVAYTDNCALCTFAAFLRLEYGLDVEAAPAEKRWDGRKRKPVGNDVRRHNYATAFHYDTWTEVGFIKEDLKYETFDYDHDSYRKVNGASGQLRYIKKKCKEAGDGAFFSICVRRAGTRDGNGNYSGHSVFCYNDKGEVKFYDSQSNERCEHYRDSKNMWCKVKPKGTVICRVDTARLNGDLLKDLVKEAD